MTDYLYMGKQQESKFKNFFLKVLLMLPKVKKKKSVDFIDWINLLDLFIPKFRNKIQSQNVLRSGL